LRVGAGSVPREAGVAAAPVAAVARLRVS